MDFYNTTRATGHALKQYEEKNHTQESNILDFFKRNPTRQLTPDEVKASMMTTMLLGSVRRGLTNLTKRHPDTGEQPGPLEKTNHKRLGPHGRPNHTWRLRLAR